MKNMDSVGGELVDLLPSPESILKEAEARGTEEPDYCTDFEERGSSFDEVVETFTDLFGVKESGDVADPFEAKESGDVADSFEAKDSGDVADPFEGLESDSFEGLDSGDVADPFEGLESDPLEAKESLSFVAPFVDPFEAKGSDPFEGWEETTLDPLDGWKETTLDPLDGWKETTLDPFEGWKETTSDPFAGWEETTSDPFAGWEETTSDPFAAFDLGSQSVDLGDTIFHYPFGICGVFSSILIDIAKIFKNFKRISGRVEDFNLNILCSEEGVEEVEQVADIMRSLLGELSAKVDVLCKHEIRSIGCHEAVVDTFEAFEYSPQSVDLSDDIFTRGGFFTKILADSEKIIKVFKHINRTVGNFNFNMLNLTVEVEELEREADVLRSLLSALSSRMSVLCKNEIRGIDSQLDIVRLKNRF